MENVQILHRAGAESWDRCLLTGMSQNFAKCCLSCLSLYCYMVTLYIGAARRRCLAFSMVF